VLIFNGKNLNGKDLGGRSIEETLLRPKEQQKHTDEKAAFPNGKAGPSTKNLGGAGLNKEDIMLNVDTFKSLCMLAKTDKGKEIRKYYVKLENIHNKIIVN
jgi:hypothetical protein